MSWDDALRAIARRWPTLPSPGDEAPVFVLASGWRTGSTLVQRMLMQHCLVWGEPFGRAMPVEHMARQLRVITADWPPDAVFVDRRAATPEGLRGEWIANLFPPLDALRRAHAAYFTTMLAEPARARGYARWGLKEVRLDASHARYLRWVFPDARLVFLIRDPYASYRSFKGLTSAYRSWPEDPVSGPEGFGRHWRALAESFADHARDLGALVLRYEDVVSPSFDPRPLEAHVGFPIDMGARDLRVGELAPPAATEDELARCGREVEPVASRLGYRRPAR